MSDVTFGPYDLLSSDFEERMRLLDQDRERENDRRLALKSTPTFFTAPNDRFTNSGDYRE